MPPPHTYTHVLHTVLTREAIRGIRYRIGIMGDYEPPPYDFRELNLFSAAVANALNCQLLHLIPYSLKEIILLEIFSFEIYLLLSLNLYLILNFVPMIRYLILVAR